MDDLCPICGRPYGGEMQEHHLKPKTFRGRTTDVHNKSNKVVIHKVCHQKVHATFAENELFNYYHSIERIVEHEQIQKFVKWLSKKPTNYYGKNDDTSSRHRKRR